VVKECQGQSGNSTNAKNFQGNIKKNVLSLSINKYPIMLKELAKRHYAHSEIVGFHFL